MSGFVWADFHGHPLRIDHEADMGYIEVREHGPGSVHRTDLTHEHRGVLADRGFDDRLLGIEIFLRGGEVRPESEPVIRRLLTEVRR